MLSNGYVAYVHRYASQYKCPHICIFDGMNILILRFRADNAAQIAAADCPVDCWVFQIGLNILQTPGSAEGPTNRKITAPYVLYLVAREGLNRVRGILAPQDLTIEGFRRHFRWYDGKTYWSSRDGTTTWDHPRGYKRRYDAPSKRWFWYLKNQNSGWDTN